MKRAKGISARLKALDKLLRDGRPRSALETACIQRQRSDLDEGHKRGLKWDEDAAERSVAFCGLLKHWKGKWSGMAFKPEPWQEHGIFAPLFGWKREEDGLRRFRTGYVEVARKNGKTFCGAMLGLQGLVADGESGAEVYSAATTRDQACGLFNDAKRCMSNRLRQIVKPWQFSITFEPLNGTFKPLSSDHDSLDGLNISRAVIDELHAHKNRGVWDVLLGAVGARSQPLIVAITTAGDDDKTICGEVRNSLAIPAALENADDSFFTFITCAEEGDDWLSPETWRKANPNLGVSLYEEFLDNLARQARVSKAAENNFRRKHLNQWVTGASEWINPTVWAKNRDTDPPNLEGRECFIGIDIGMRDDFAAVGRLFPERIEIGKDNTLPARAGKVGEPPPVEMEAEPVRAKYKVRKAFVDVTLWVPENGRRDVQQAPLVNWIDQGLVTVAGGNSTDFDAIIAQVHEDARRYDVRQIAIDPHNARQLGNALVEDGFEVFEFIQNTHNYHEPTVEFAVLAAEGLMRHNGHEVLAWMIRNVRLRSRNGYVMPWKDKCPEKIDGAAALLMAMGAAMFCEIEPSWNFQPGSLAL
jgi:phage terminase large subunit-like protein